jgi:fucose permease
MWGVGASVSPYIMSYALVSPEGWSYGYLIVSVIQAVLSVVIFISIPLFKKGSAHPVEASGESSAVALSFREIFAIKGAVPCFLTFFCYCALELTTSLWASTYLVERWSFTPEIAAGFASMFYIGITAGRFVNGFLAMRIGDRFLIRGGMAIVAVGILFVIMPFHSALALIGFLIIGLGCAPIYPCIIHMTPDVFGRDKSQAMIGVQMAFAYVGFLVMPPLFGVIAEKISISLLPLYQAVILAVMIAMHELMLARKNKTEL